MPGGLRRPDGRWGLRKTGESRQNGSGLASGRPGALWARGLWGGSALPWPEPKEDSNLVDSASSHTLVSKTKPCKSKYKSFTLKLRMAHYISYSLFDSPLLFG